jgi:hypothetical protein
MLSVEVIARDCFYPGWSVRDKSGATVGQSLEVLRQGRKQNAG